VEISFNRDSLTQQELGHMMRRLRDRSDRGASAVEFALLLPVLLLLIFGIIDFGRILTAEIQLSQAAREGVRLQALGLSGFTVRAEQAAPMLKGEMDVSPGSTCSPASLPTDVAQVTATWTATGLLIPGLPTKYSQTAEMRCGG
jgi:hypothetical protein